MITECAINMMILAVNVCSNCAAHADVFCAWQYRREQPLRYAQPQNFSEGYPGTATDAQVVSIERNKVIQEAATYHLLGQCAVTIAAARTPRDEARAAWVRRQLLG